MKFSGASCRYRSTGASNCPVCHRPLFRYRIFTGARLNMLTHHLRSRCFFLFLLDYFPKSKCKYRSYNNVLLKIRFHVCFVFAGIILPAKCVIVSVTRRRLRLLAPENCPVCHHYKGGDTRSIFLSVDFCPPTVLAGIILILLLSLCVCVCVLYVCVIYASLLA